MYTEDGAWQGEEHKTNQGCVQRMGRGRGRSIRPTREEGEGQGEEHTWISPFHRNNENSSASTMVPILFPKNGLRRPLPLPMHHWQCVSLPDPTQQLEFPCEDDKFTLPELVDGYSPLFPIRVRVVKGYYGERGESSAIATDELYNFHFIKRAKVYGGREERRR